jgi:hypothetical protein
MLLVSFMAAGLVLAQAQHTVLTTGLPVWDALAEDVNGDGFKDVLVYSSDDEAEAPTKELRIFLAGEKGRFGSAATVRFPLPSTNGTAFVSEFDGAPPREIILFDQGAATVMRLTGGTLSEVFRTEFVSLLPTGSREPVFLRAASKDLDGDGRDEWLLPLADGFGVFSAGKLTATLPAPTTSELRDYSNFQISHRLPAVSTFALPGERLSAVALLSDTQADFSYGEGWREHVRYPIPRRLDKKWDASAELDDVNADGWPDLMVTQTSGTINLKTETQVYLATGPFNYPPAPNARVTRTGSFASAALRDTNGDKKLDLIFISVPLGIGNIINYFLRQKVTVEAAVYEYGPDGLADKPSRKAALTLDAPEGRERSAYAMGDFDGDGFLDAAVGTGAQMMSFYRGSSREFLSTSPWVKLEMPTFGIARTGDLDGNGKEDLLLIHPSGPNEKRIEVVMF